MDELVVLDRSFIILHWQMYRNSLSNEGCWIMFRITNSAFLVLVRTVKVSAIIHLFSRVMLDKLAHSGRRKVLKLLGLNENQKGPFLPSYVEVSAMLSGSAFQIPRNNLFPSVDKGPVSDHYFLVSRELKPKVDRR